MGDSCQAVCDICDVVLLRRDLPVSEERLIGEPCRSSPVKKEALFGTTRRWKGMYRTIRSPTPPDGPPPAPAADFVCLGSGWRYCAIVQPDWSDGTRSDAVPRFGKTVRILALIVVIALILLTVVPVLVRVSRSGPSTPATTQPGIVASRSVGANSLVTGGVTGALDAMNAMY